MMKERIVGQHSFCKQGLWGLVLILIATGLSSCDKEDLFGSFFTSGDRISFYARTNAAKIGLTKTEYYFSKKEDPNNDWENNIKFEIGDQLSIYSPQAVIYDRERKVHIWPAIATYKVIAPYSGASLAENEAMIATISDNEENSMDLDWGDETVTHEFRAVYPAVNTKLNDTVLTDFRHNDPRWEYVFTLPSSQPYESYTKSGSCYVFTPHMEYLPLMARANISQNDRANHGIKKDGTKSGTVFLDFKPMMTAIEFTIESGFELGSMSPEYVIITSKSHILAAGAYMQFNTTGAEQNADTRMGLSIDPWSRRYKHVSIRFSDAITLAKGESLRFTLFFMEGADDLTFIYKDKSFGTKSLAIKKADTETQVGEYLSFPRYSKSYIKGVIVPNNAEVHWDVAFSAKAAYWNKDDGYVDATVY